MGIVNDILDFSKIEANRLTLEKVCFAPRDTLRRVISLFGPQASQKGIDLTLEIDQRLPVLVAGDPLRLEQVLVNLVGNAVKFTDAGQVLIRAELDALAAGKAANNADDESCVLRFTVQDTGKGMEDHQMPLLFEPFWQADSSTTRTHGGTGLGLPISKQLVELMGGHIYAACQPDQGCVFWFTVRLGLGKETAQCREIQDFCSFHAPTTPTSHLKGRRVLVVDDSEMNRELAVDLLVNLGMETAIATNGREAVQRVTEAYFDLVLMDIQMPILDGLDATREIRKWERFGMQKAAEEEAGAIPGREDHDPPCADGSREISRRMPIIAMTALAMVGDREEFLRAGLDDYLPKPVPPAKLVEALLRWLPGPDCSAMEGERPVSASVQSDPDQRASGVRSCLRILIADDKAFNRELLSDALELSGHQTVLAVNGAEAVALYQAQAQAFDAVILDWHMPGMDGLEAARCIRAHERHFGRSATPLIAVSADARELPKTLVRELGMAAVISKPVSVPDLHAVLAGVPSGRIDQPPTAVTSLSAKVIEDLGADLKRREGFWAMLREDIHHDLNSLRGAFAARDHEALSRSAHSLKGLCAQLEDPTISLLAAEIQTNPGHVTVGQVEALANSIAVQCGCPSG
jgi:two-component system, sensor histidine kinase and response regulator